MGSSLGNSDSVRCRGNDEREEERLRFPEEK